jgi:hypothetical protein
VSACRSCWRGVGRRTFEDSDGGGEVVDSTGSLESGNDDRRSGDQIVGEGVVQVALSDSSVRLGCDQTRDYMGKSTWSSKTSWTPSNSFSYLD